MARRRSHTETWWAAADATVLRCTTSLKSTGERCKFEASPGTNVCDKHGALIPSVRNAAATRIQMSVDDAARQVVAWMNDPSVDMRERIKIAHDLLDRGGLGATSKHLIGVADQDPVVRLFASIAADPEGLLDPATPPPPEDPEVLELNRLADADIYDAEVVEDDVEEPVEEPRAQTRPSVTPRRSQRGSPDPGPPPPAHIRKVLEQLL